MHILLLPLTTRVYLDLSQIESGRGLRAIISALEQKVQIITADTPYTRDYLSNYSCAYLLPQHSSAKSYHDQILATLKKGWNENSCKLSPFSHDFRAETALPKLIDIIYSTMS